MPALRTTSSNRPPSTPRGRRRVAARIGGRRSSIITVLLAVALSLSTLVIPSPAAAKPSGGPPLQAVASVTSPVPVPGGSTADARVDASGGSSPYTYSWSQVSGPKVSFTAKKDKVSFVAPDAGGDVKLAAVVADRNGQRATAEVVIPTSRNAVVVIASGPPAPVVVGSAATLAVKASGGRSPYSYAWSQVGGEAVKLTGANGTSPSFTAMTPGDRTFKVVVTDTKRLTGEATVTVTVTPAPAPAVTASGPKEPVAGGKRVNLAANVSGGVKPYRFAWKQTGGATVRLSDPSVADPRFDAPQEGGDLTFEVTVTDAVGGSATAAVTVAVIGNKLAVTASASHTEVRAFDIPELRAEATGGRAPYAYEWKQVSGDRVVLWTPWWSSTRFLVPHDAGVMTFEVTVTDRTGAKVSAPVVIRGPKPDCAAPFRTQWDKARAGRLFPTDLGPIGKASAGIADAGSTCDPAAGFNVRDVDVSLFNGALTGDDLTGRVTANGLCLDGGTVRLRAAWGDVTEALAPTNPLCVPLGELLPPPATLTATGTPTINGLPLGPAPSTIVVSPTSLALTSTGPFPVGGTHAVELTVAPDGRVSGTVALTGVPVFGTTVELRGAITGTPDAPLAAPLEAALPGPLAIAPGVVLENLTAKVDAGRLAFGGSARIGGATPAGIAAATADGSIVVAITGHIADGDDWVVDVTPAAGSWSVTHGLVLAGTLDGTITSAGGAVAVDVTVAPPAGGNVARWELGGGAAAVLTGARIGNGAAPATCGTAVPAGNLWVATDGSLELRPPGDTPVTLPVAGCVDPAGGSFGLRADASAPIVLTDQVSLGDDFAFVLTGDRTGSVTGAGSGTITVTVDGKPQTVTATATVLADGTIVVGATVDLAPWGLGTGSAKVWFATGPVAEFDTGDPSIGTIKLDEGLTAALTYEIPAAAFATLTGVLGLDLASPSITVGTGIDDDGETSGRVSVGVKPNHDLLANVPGGVRFEGGTLELTDDHVTVQLTGPQRSATVTVKHDGSLTGDVRAEDVAVLGAELDASGTIDAAAGGPVTGSLTATLAGPVDLGGGASLKDATVTLDGMGVKVAGSATVAGSAPLAVRGTYVDLDDWSFTIDSANPDGWAVRPDLVLRGRLTGSIASVAGAVTFDVVAGSADQAIADWDLGGGNRLRLVSGRVTNTPAPLDCTTFVAPGSVWVSAIGSIELGDGTVPVDACVNPATGSWVVRAAATAPIILSDRVNLGSDLQLAVRRGDDGAVTGAGSGTVTFTAGGKAQAVAATMSLRRGGAFVIGATVDLAQWDLGAGTANAWFATARVERFDTGVPALGTIDLPASLTVGVAYDIPAAAYPTLTDVVGLDLTSPTITVVAGVGTTDGFTGRLNVRVKPNHDLLANVPNGVQFQGATLTFTDTGVTVDLTGDKRSGHLVVRNDGSLSGTVDLRGVPVLGGGLDVAGAVNAPAGGPVTGSLTATLAGPVDLGGGASLKDVTVTLDGSGVKVAGSATVAGSAPLAVTGTYTDADDWSFTIDSANPDGWAVRPDLVLRGRLTGSIASVAGAVTFDVTAGSADQPIADWDLGAGNRLRLLSGRVTNTPAPVDCTTFVAPGDVWVSASGQLELGATAIPATACINPAAGIWVVSADATGPIVLNDDVTLGDDLALTVRRNPDGAITGTGTATVTMTVGGKAQTAAATISLRSDGTVVVGATVELAQWGLGTGSANAWFATRAVKDFDTAVPGIGIIDLAAGLTVGIAYEIPAAAYSTLTNVVGLDLQDPTLTVVASVGTNGEFTGRVNVGVKPDHDLLANVPNGVRFEGAALTFTHTGVTVDLTGSKGSGHLVVRNDGSLTGDVELAGVRVFGGLLDFAGTISAPVAGPITGSLTASLAGPIEAAGAQLKDLTVTLDGSGVKVAGSAVIAGSAALAIAGTYSDADDWSFTIDSANPDGWAVRADLVLRGRLSGSIASVAGAVTFDVVAGSADQPIAEWDLGAGNRLRLVSGRVTNTAAPADCTTFVAPGEVWVSATGELVLGAATIPATTCINPAAGTWVVSADATGPIQLGDNVSLADDLALIVRRNPDGAITGTGTATVTVTVGGKAQTAAATISLRPGGTLVVGATVDLAQWDLGAGNGHVWFATAAVNGFDTRDPAIGTINLPGGLTVGISHEIPAAAYTTLTDVVGLDLSSNVLTVVASVTADGTFTATANVGVKPDHDLLANVPGGVRFSGATLVFGNDHVTVDLAGPTATAHLTVTADGSVSGDVDLKGVPVLGTTVDLRGDVTAPAGGTVTGSLTADIAGPLDLGGAVLTSVHLTLGADGFTVAGDARIAGPDGPVVKVAGTVADTDNWSLTVSSTTASSWPLLPGLTLNGNLAGTISSTAGVVTFDLTAGTPEAALAAWDLGGGNTVRLATARVSNTSLPAECAIAAMPGHVWVQAAGALDLDTGATSTTIPVTTCIDADSGAFAVKAAATAPIVVTDQVRIGQDLVLTVTGDGTGAVSGTGTAPVTFTVGGKEQTVTATISLRADGTLVIGASVDLAQWNLGTGSAHLWYASGPVAGFDTGDAALGTVDLPAGLTVGIAYTIPEAAFVSLTGHLGLDIARPTLTVLASVRADGTFTAKVTVPAKPDAELLPGVPGGLHLSTAELTISPSGFTVDLVGRAGATGTMAGHLAVAADGAVDGRIELHGVPVLGQPLSLTGTLSVPAGGILTGTLTADLPGPVTVADGIVLSGIHVTLDPGGLAITAGARIAGPNGPSVTVAGTVADDANWSLQLTSEQATGWIVRPGLTLNAVFSGTLRSVDGVVAFDITAGSTDQALATWDLGDGNEVRLDLARVADVAAVEPCTATIGAGNVWLQAGGTLHLAGAGTPVDLPVNACVDLATGAFSIKARAGAPVYLSPAVTLGPDLALTLEGDAEGRIAGAGQATVTFSAAGKAQSALATIRLRSDGALVIGASVDLSQWDLGDGLGHVWFASKALTGFDTGDPALGRIDLPAGLTVGISYSIPAAAYAALTETLGLDLASPTITVVASVDAGGRFVATAKVKTKPGRQVVPNIPGGLQLGDVTLTITNDGVSVAAAGTAGATGDARIDLTVRTDGSVAGSVELYQLPILGTPVDLIGTMSAPAGGPLTGTLTADIPGPLAIGTNLSLRDVHLALVPQGIALAGTAQIGGTGGPTVTVAGHLTDPRNWTLEVTSAAAAPWSPVPGLTVDATLVGTIRSVDGAVTFDVTAGGAGALASWDLGGGNAIALTSLRVANTPIAASCGTGAADGDVWLEADGGLTVASVAGSPVAVPVHACVNATSKAFTVTAEADAPIALSPQVQLAALDLAISGDGAGAFSGTGTATVSITVDGKPQTVTATLQLRRDGAFIVGADVDLTQWGMGGGLGHAWFATAPAKGFATGDPALGSIDLPAGLTVGISYQIPAAAYAALAETLGLDLANPTITVVASITDTGFSAVATVKTKPGRELVPGIPGGVRLDTASLTFTDAGVTAAFDAAVGSGGNAHADLFVGADGSVSGNLAVRGVTVFGQTLDLVGTLSAPAGGPLTGSATATIPGPLAVADGVVLTGITVTADPRGLQVAASAQLGGDGGIAARIDGAYADTRNWSLRISATGATEYEVNDRITVNGDLGGEVTAVDGVVTFDVVFGQEGRPVATWSLSDDSAIVLSTARVSNRPVAPECGLFVPAGDVWVRVEGGLALDHAAPSGATTLTIPVEGCVELATGGFRARASATAPIKITDQVTIGDDLHLEIVDSGWYVSGEGGATVTFLVDGKPQSVEAAFELTSDGALVISAEVDLGDWGLGDGTGHIWFASAEVPFYDTGDPELGYLDLPAGLTAALSYEIPETVYATLTEQLGIQIPDRTLRVVASITAGGSFQASVTLHGSGDGHTILDGIPGGVRLNTASLRFDEHGVTARISASASDDGSGELDLRIGDDGSISGSIDVRYIRLVGDAHVDLAGTIDAPAGGPISGSIHGRIDGPVFLMHDFLALDHVEVAYTDAGLDVSGTAWIGTRGAEGWGEVDTTQAVKVDVAGRVSDTGNWSLSVTTAATQPWQVTETLQVNASVQGDLRAEDGEITYDVALGNETAPLATVGFHGHNATLQTARLSNRTAPAECGALDMWAGQPWLAATGSVTLAFPGGQTVTTALHGCYDVQTSAFTIATTVTGAVVVNDQVRIEPGATLTFTGRQVWDWDGSDAEQVVTADGSAQVSFTVNGTKQTVDATLRYTEHGAFIVGASIDLGQWNLGQGTGYAWFTSKAVDGFDGEQLGTLSLPAGLTVGFSIPISDQASHAMRSKLRLNVPLGRLTAIGQVGTDGSFSAEIRLRNIPFAPMGTPRQGELEELLFTVDNGGVVLDGHGTAGDDAGNVGRFSLHLAIATDGTIDGSMTVEDMPIMGTVVDLAGEVSAGPNQDLDFDLVADLPGPLVIGEEFSLANVKAHISALEGLEISGDALVGPPGRQLAVSLRGDIDGDDWSILGRATLPEWTPIDGMTFSPNFSVSASMQDGTFAWNFSAYSFDEDRALFDWQPNEQLQVRVLSLGIGNGTGGTDCTNAAPGDISFWTAGTGGLTLADGGGVKVYTSACINLTTGDVNIEVKRWGSEYWHLGPATVTAFDLEFNRNGRTGAMSFEGHAAGQILLKGNVVEIELDVELNADGVLIHATADVSSFTGATALAHLYYTDVHRFGYPTGDPVLGGLDLRPGFTVAVRMGVPAKIRDALKRSRLAIDLGDAEVKAIASVDLSGNFDLQVGLRLPSPGVLLFSTTKSPNDPNSTWLRLTEVYVGLEDSTRLEIGAQGTLRFPAMKGSQESIVTVDATVHINVETGAVSVGASIVGTWHDAFGIAGLDVAQFAIEGGVDAGGIPMVGLSAKVIGLPDDLAQATGYQEGVPMTLSFNFSLTTPMLEIEVGETGSTTPVMKPGQQANAANALLVYHARLYIAPKGVSIGGVRFPAGYALDFDAKLGGSPLTFAVSFDPTTKRLKGDANIPRFQIGRSITIHGLRVHLDTDPSRFEFQLNGSATFGKVNVIADIAVGGAGASRFDVRTVDAIPGLTAPLQVSGTMDNETGHVEGQGETQVKIGDLLKNAKVDMTDDGLLLTLDHDGWAIKATVSLSGLEAEATKVERATIDAMPVFKAGGELRYKIRVVINGSGFHATAGAAGVVWAEVPVDLYKHHEGVVASFTVRIHDSQVCIPIVGIKACFAFDNPFSGPGFAPATTAVPADQPSPAELRGLTVTEVPADAVREIPAQPATGAVVTAPEQVPVPV